MVSNIQFFHRKKYLDSLVKADLQGVQDIYQCFVTKRACMKHERRYIYYYKETTGNVESLQHRSNSTIALIMKWKDLSKNDSKNSCCHI
jgi:hypothetical protein